MVKWRTSAKRETRKFYNAIRRKRSRREQRRQPLGPAKTARLFRWFD